MQSKKVYLFPANGIHHHAYEGILSNPLAIVYPPLRDATTPIPKNLSWHYFHDDCQNFISGHGLHGLGHSLGGTLLLYDAIKHPNRWDTIVIVEPALFSQAVIVMAWVVRFLNLSYYLHPMIRITKHRRSTFKNKETVFNRWRNHAAFKNLSDASLTQFIEASLTNDGYQLRFPKQWEIEIYKSMGTLDSFIWKNLHKLTSKLVVVAAETSNTFLTSARQQLKRHAQEFLTIPNTSHLLPFETPNALKTIMNNITNPQKQCLTACLSSIGHCIYEPTPWHDPHE